MTTTTGSGISVKHSLAELMLYVAKKSEEDRFFGATKLNKILFYSDFLAYRQFGTSITGATYQKLDHGPAPRELLPARQILLSSRAATLNESYLLGKRQVRLVANRNADLSAFDDQQIDLVDQVIEQLHGVSGNAISEYSHKHVGWRLASLNEDIPYSTALVSDEPATDSDVARGLELAKEHGWFRSTAA